MGRPKKVKFNFSSSDINNTEDLNNTNTNENKEDVNSEEEQNNTDIFKTGMSESQTLDLQDVLKELPIDLVKNLPTIASRLNSFITFYSTLNLKRLSKLTNYVIKAEEVLFDESNLLNQDNETIKENYKQAKTASLEILDLARKVAAQIPQEETANKDVDEVYKLLKSLSPEAIESIKENLVSLKSTEEE